MFPVQRLCILKQRSLLHNNPFRSDNHFNYTGMRSFSPVQLPDAFSDKKPAVVPGRTVRGAKQRLQAGGRGGEEPAWSLEVGKRLKEVLRSAKRQSRHIAGVRQGREGEAGGAVRSTSKCFTTVRIEAGGAGSSSGIGL